MSDRVATFERVLALEPGRTALVVVDMQRGFLDPGEALEVPPAREIVPAVRTLLEAFRARRLRATLDIVGRAVGRVVSSKHVLDTLGGW